MITFKTSRNGNVCKENEKMQMIRTCSVNESLILNHARSISKSLFEAQMAPALQQFKFVAARLARTTISSDDIQGSSQSSGSEEAKQLNSYISLSALDLHLQQMHWISGLSRSISITIKVAQLHRIYGCTCLASLRRADFLRLWASDSRTPNRMNTSLEMCVCLKLNPRILKETGFVFL